MDSPLVIDTSVFVDQFRAHPDATRFLAPLLATNAVLLHPVVFAEVLAGARDARHLRSLDKALSAVPLARVKGNDLIAALDLVRLHQLGDGIGWPDCLIAATCVRLDATLVTLNAKHFQPIRGLRVARPY